MSLSIGAKLKFAVGRVTWFRDLFNVLLFTSVSLKLQILLFKFCRLLSVILRLFSVDTGTKEGIELRPHVLPLSIVVDGVFMVFNNTGCYTLSNPGGGSTL